MVALVSTRISGDLGESSAAQQETIALCDRVCGLGGLEFLSTLGLRSPWFLITCFSILSGFGGKVMRTFSEGVQATVAERVGSDLLGLSSMRVVVRSSGVWVMASKCRPTP